MLTESVGIADDDGADDKEDSLSVSIAADGEGAIG
jgi:hypothetical protein